MLLKEMIRRKQVELLGGAYYSPILPLIPDGDKLGQIEKMTTFIRTTFGTRPRGSWIAERVWEPGLARILRNSGIEYTFLDDRNFHSAGVEEQSCYQPYLTEDQGKVITVFPLHAGLGNSVTVAAPEDLILELHGISTTDHAPVAVILIPGESLAGDAEALYGENGWLFRFYHLLEQNREWLHPRIPRFSPEVLCPQGRLYFPCLSSPETMNGSLSPARQRACQEIAKKLRKPDSVFVRRGFFRQFLTRFPEIGLLYARMMYTHVLVSQIRGDKYKKKAALGELWRGQTGAVYWHGRQAGAYSNPLRKAAYCSFIEAEKLTRKAGMFMPAIIATDYDLDGQDEYLYQGKVINIFVHRRGGVALELDYLPRCWNYLDTIARWPEQYHRYKYEGCDRYMRRAFIDHFFAPSTTLEKFDRMTYQELGDFIEEPFELEELKRETRTVILSREGNVRFKRRTIPVTLRKSYSFRENGIELDLSIRNIGSFAVELWYGIEINLSLGALERANITVQQEDKETRIDHEAVQLDSIGGVRIHDGANRVQISLAADRAFSLWSLPVYTMSYDWNQLRRMYQSSCFVPQWQLELQPEQSAEIKFNVDLRKR